MVIGVFILTVKFWWRDVVDRPTMMKSVITFQKDFCHLCTSNISSFTQNPQLRLCNGAEPGRVYCRIFSRHFQDFDKNLEILQTFSEIRIFLKTSKYSTILTLFNSFRDNGEHHGRTEQLTPINDRGKPGTNRNWYSERQFSFWIKFRDTTYGG